MRSSKKTAGPPAPSHPLPLTWHRLSPAGRSRTHCLLPSARRATSHPWWAACRPPPRPPTHRTARTAEGGHRAVRGAKLVSRVSLSRGPRRSLCGDQCSSLGPLVHSKLLKSRICVLLICAPRRHRRNQEAWSPVSEVVDKKTSLAPRGGDRG